MRTVPVVVLTPHVSSVAIAEAVSLIEEVYNDNHTIGGVFLDVDEGCYRLTVTVTRENVGSGAIDVFMMGQHVRPTQGA